MWSFLIQQRGLAIRERVWQVAIVLWCCLRHYMGYSKVKIIQKHSVQVLVSGCGKEPESQARIYYSIWICDDNDDSQSTALLSSPLPTQERRFAPA